MKLKIISIMVMLLVGISSVSYATCGACCGGGEKDPATGTTESTEDAGNTETAETE